MPTYTTRITPAYDSLRSLYLGTEAWGSGFLEPGRATVLIEGDETFSAEGRLNARGGLSGMARLYRQLLLKPGAEVRFTVPSKNTIKVVPSLVESAPPPVAEQTVFERRKLKHLHIEPFRPENLKHWEPETETDVYLAFGVLQEFTDFQYCCGASKELLLRLGAFDEACSKPDAILIDRTTDQYLVAEWKMRSSQFKLNHGRDHVDVLVCWLDAENDKSVLPPRVLSLREIAKKAAEESLGDEAG